MRTESELWTFVRARADELRRHPTKQEALLAKALDPSEWNFQEPVVLRGPRGKWHPIIFDFAHKKRMLAIEVDGSSHRKKQGHDERRDLVCSFNGIYVIRFTNKEIDKDLVGCITRIRGAA